MKTKAIILIAISAVLTFSFTFISVNKPKKEVNHRSLEKSVNEPAGGFVIEDKL